jgi:hypothetical protein
MEQQDRREQRADLAVAVASGLDRTRDETMPTRKRFIGSAADRQTINFQPKRKGDAREGVGAPDGG